MIEHFWTVPWGNNVDPHEVKKANNCYSIFDVNKHNDWCENDFGRGWAQVNYNINPYSKDTSGCVAGSSAKPECKRNYAGVDAWDPWRNMPDDKVRVFSGVDGTKSNDSSQRYIDFSPGEYPNLDSLGWNDKITSFSIPQSLNATFYQDSGFGGNNFSITGNNEFQNLPSNWIAQISSIKISKNCDVDVNKWDSSCENSCQNNSTCWNNRKNYCTDPKNVNTKECNTWCQQNLGICDASVSQYCKNNPNDMNFCGCYNFDSDTKNIISQLSQKGQTIIPTCNINNCVNNGLAYKPKQQGNCPSEQICLQGINIGTSGKTNISNATFNCNQTSQTNNSINGNTQQPDFNTSNNTQNNNQIPNNPGNTGNTGQTFLENIKNMNFNIYIILLIVFILILLIIFISI